MAVAGHQITSTNSNTGSGNGNSNITGITFIGNGVNNFVSASTTDFFFNSYSGSGGTKIYLQNDVLIFSSTPATTVIINNNGINGVAKNLSVIGVTPSANTVGDTGVTTSIKANVVDNVLNRSGNTLIFSQTRTNCYEDYSVTYVKIQKVEPYSLIGNETCASGVSYGVSSTFPYDNAQGQFKNSRNDIDEIYVGCIFTLITSVTVSSLTTTNILPEYSSYTTFIGTRTFPLKYLKTGKNIRLKGFGSETHTGLTDSLILTLKLINTANTETILGIITANTHYSATTNNGFQLEFNSTCYTTGTGGTIMTQGMYITKYNTFFVENTIPVIINTEEENYLQLSAIWNNTGNKIIFTNSTIEILN